MREAAGKKWVDKSMAEWPENDYRIFVGDLGHEVRGPVGKEPWCIGGRAKARASGYRPASCFPCSLEGGTCMVLLAWQPQHLSWHGAACIAP